MKTPKKILVVYKTTAFDEFEKRTEQHHLKLSRQNFQKQFPDFIEAHEAHEYSLKQSLFLLKKLGFEVTIRSRRSSHLKGKHDLVLTVGGDGTFLRASHTVTDELMLGVNSAPSHSVGALCSVHIGELESKLVQIQENHFRISNLNRLQIILNKKPLKLLALNDVLLANRSPAGTSRYQIRVGQMSEDQKSSGVWVSSASGSTAAIFAAGGCQMPRLSRRIQYLVREAYKRHDPLIKLKKGLINPGETIEFTIEMHEACLFIDGPNGKIPLQFGDHVVISNASKPLRVIN